jgi:predicted porin
MNKALIALLALGAAAGSAAAQSNVQMYGVLDAGIAVDTDGLTKGHALKVESGQEAGTRFGFRGSEKISDTLSANFKLEMGVGLDNGASTQGGVLFGRQASVGLAGSGGAINLGRLNTPSFNAMIAIDPMRTGFFGYMNGVFGGGGLRNNNAVNYFTPVVGGFSGEFMYSLGEVAGNARSGRQFGFNLGYTQGPIVARLAQHDASDVTGAILSKNTLLGGVYNFGPVKLHAAYAVNKNNATLDTRDTMVGFTLPMGVHTVKSSYITRKDRRFADADFHQYSIAYTYALSKRTDLYASYTQNANDGTVKYNSAANGLDARVVQLGIRHDL